MENPHSPPREGDRFPVHTLPLPPLHEPLVCDCEQPADLLHPLLGGAQPEGREELQPLAKGPPNPQLLPGQTPLGLCSLEQGAMEEEDPLCTAGKALKQKRREGPFCPVPPAAQNQPSTNQIQQASGEGKRAA